MSGPYPFRSRPVFMTLLVKFNIIKQNLELNFKNENKKKKAKK